MDPVIRVDSTDGEIGRLRRLFERNPTSTLFARLADACLCRGDVDEAIEVCRRGLRYRPSYVTGHLVLGRAFVAARDDRSAEDEFRKVLRLDPDNPAALGHLAQLAAREGQPDRARDFVARLRLQNPFDPRVIEGELTAGSHVGQADRRVDAPLTGVEAPADEEADGAAATDEADARAPTDEAFPFVSLTLARLYASQGHRREAERVVRLVDPSKADELLGRMTADAAN